MKRELHYFDVYPKVLPAGEKNTITAKCLDRRFKLPDGKVRVEVIPMTESPQASEYLGTTRTTLEAEAYSKDGHISISYHFGKEQEYRLKLYLREDEWIMLSVYAVEKDLYERIPLKGDLHAHTSYSDGWESPEVIVGYYRKAGFDFMLISDHRNYKGSEAAVEFFKGVNIDLNIVKGEEVHAPKNYVHIVNFGGEFSVNDIYAEDEERYYAEVEEIISTFDPSMNFQHEDEKFAYASCLWVYERIRKGKGLAILAHPHWIVDNGHNLRDSMTILQFKQKCFDAFELLGGQTPAENNMQIAFYLTACKNGYGDFPVLGSSDAHGTIAERFMTESSFAAKHFDPHGFLEFYSLVFAKSNDKDEIISSIKDGFCLAIEHYKGGVPRVYGDYRLVSFALFLLREYFPLHDEICYEEGRLMLEFARDNDVKQDLENKAGRVGNMLRKYWGL